MVSIKAILLMERLADRSLRLSLKVIHRSEENGEGYHESISKDV